MVTDFAHIDPNGIFSYADYLSWKFEERVEIIKGKIFKMSPAPSVKHQKVSTRLIGELLGAFKGKSCNLFHAPFDVRLLDAKKSKAKNKEIYTVVQPDICIICDENKLDEKGCIGAPDWIIEILSPGSVQHDIKRKYQLYQENLVPEYWIVHPTEHLIQAYTLQPNGEYGHYRVFSEDEDHFATSDIFPELQIDLKEIFS
jgi:Uma2 family endonuclease